MVEKAVEKVDKSNKLTRRDVTSLFPRFPSILGSNIWDNFWSDFTDLDTFWGSANTTPYDIIQHKDDNGNVIATEFQYALAGYDEKDVAVEVDDNELKIKVEKSEQTEDQDEKKVYVRRGLAKRSMQWSYVLNNRVDKDNITAEVKNGMLNVKVPVLPEKEVKRIEVKKVE